MYENHKLVICCIIKVSQTQLKEVSKTYPYISNYTAIRRQKW